MDEWEKEAESQGSGVVENETVRKTIPFYKSPIFRHIAASVAIIAGLGSYYVISHNNDTQIAYDKDTFTNPDEAYEKSAKALALFSRTIEMGEKGVDKAEAKTSNIINKLDKYIQ